MALKFLLLAAAIAFAVWIVSGRRQRPADKPVSRRSKPRAPEAMLQCVHCGVHLPQPEARMDAAGRPYCSDAHRLLGPR